MSSWKRSRSKGGGAPVCQPPESRATDGSGDGVWLEDGVARQLNTLLGAWARWEEGLDGEHRSGVKHVCLLILCPGLSLCGLRPVTQSLCTQNAASFLGMLCSLNKMMHVRHQAQPWAGASPVLCHQSCYSRFVLVFLLKSYLYIAFLEIFKKLIFFYCYMTSKIMFAWLWVYFFFFFLRIERLSSFWFLETSVLKFFFPPKWQYKKTPGDFVRDKTVYFSLSNN